MVGVLRNILLLGIFVAAIAFAPLPVWFYIFARIILCACAICAIVLMYAQNSRLWIMGAVLAILYNPIFPVYLGSKQLWSPFNVITIMYFFIVMLMTYNKEKK